MLRLSHLGLTPIILSLWLGDGDQSALLGFKSLSFTWEAFFIDFYLERLTTNAMMGIYEQS